MNKNSKATGSISDSVQRVRQLKTRLALFLGIISFVLYANTIDHVYVLDDLTAIRENEHVKAGISGIPKILTTPYLDGFKKYSDPVRVNDPYRPLPLVMFAVEYQLSDGAPAVSHLMNILLFAGCVILLFLFLDQLFDGKRTGVALMAALLFAVHPVHTEVVANIKSRDELLCFFFAFYALISFIGYSRSGGTYKLVAGALCLLLSLLSKETSVSLLLVIPVIFFFYVNDNRKRAIGITLWAVGVVMVYLAIRSAVMRTHNAVAASEMDFINNMLAGAPRSSGFATAILMLGYYIRLLFVPYPLISEYGYNTIPIVDFANVWVILSLALYIALLAVGLYRLIKRGKDPYAFGILFFLVTMAMFSNLVFLVGATMAERFLFFGSAGFCLVLASLLWSWFFKVGDGVAQLFKPARIWAILIPVCLVFSVLTMRRNAEWKDNYTLFSADVRKAPNGARLWFSLGYELTTTVINDEQDVKIKNELMQEGISCLQRSVAIYPAYGSVHNSLGNLFRSIQQYDSAETHLRIQIALQPRNVIALSDLGFVYFWQRKYDSTISLCRQALRIDPRNAGVMNNLAMCYIQLGVYDSVAELSKRVLEVEPENELAKRNLELGRKGLEAGGPNK